MSLIACSFAFNAGSSLPVAWRLPAVDMPYGAEVEELMSVAYGGIDSYDFHALECIQCMAERRQGEIDSSSSVSQPSACLLMVAIMAMVAHPHIGVTGGETGVLWVEALEGDAFWKAMRLNSW